MPLPANLSAKTSHEYWRIHNLKRRQLIVFGFLFSIVISGCGRKKIHVGTSESLGPQGSSFPLEEKVGQASWYGDPYHGRRTSNGETYNKFTMTAAHRTLPFDTMVKVNNLENGKNVTVRINDRGPFVKDRIIDLSYVAAREIEMLKSGTARVSLDILKAVPNPFPLTIQVASFRGEPNARELKKNLEKEFKPIFIKKFDSPEGHFFRVLAGEFRDPQAAEVILKKLKTRKYDGFLVRMDP